MHPFKIVLTGGALAALCTASAVCQTHQDPYGQPKPVQQHEPRGTQQDGMTKDDPWGQQQQVTLQAGDVILKGSDIVGATIYLTPTTDRALGDEPTFGDDRFGDEGLGDEELGSEDDDLGHAGIGQEEIGSIHDLVLDEQGTIVAVLVDTDLEAALDDRFGEDETLGEREGFIAVPAKLLVPRGIERADGKNVVGFDGFTMKGDKSMLIGAVRYSEDNPLDERSLASVHDRFGLQMPGKTMGEGTTGMTGQRPGMDEEPGMREPGLERQPGLEQEREVARAGEKGCPIARNTGWTLASKVLDSNALGADGEDLGEIEDLAFAASSQQLKHGVLYAVLESGGFLGMGEKQFAVPFDAIHVAPDDDVVRLGVTADALEEAEGFNDDRWPNQPNESLFARGPNGKGRPGS